VKKPAGCTDSDSVSRVSNVSVKQRTLVSDVCLECYPCSDFIYHVVKRLDIGEWYAREWCAMCPSPEPDQKTLFAPITATMFRFRRLGSDPLWWAKHRSRFGKVIFLVIFLMMVS
jgi:hypothetical protein